MVEARRERKVVTVLFADLVGFTSRSEQLDPEDVADELSRYHARVRAELERHGGTVEKFIGDAAMAIFGAPVSHEDDAERAVRAGLSILDWASEEGVEMRVGINSGEALVTVDARPEAGETMAAGDVVNTAARLQSAAPVNAVLVGEQTFRATERAIEYRDAPAVEAKGKSEPVPAWIALRPRARVGVDRVHGATLVGRTREVALLEDALARTMEERSTQLLTLVGVPGIGKSRLVLELFHAIERRPDLIHWRHGRCLPYGDGVTFWALGEMVKAQAGILEGDEAAEAERKLAAVVDDPWIESHLRPLVGLGGGSEARGDAREAAFTAWRRFFEGLADERPLVLVFEDLHWADDHLLDFVDNLVDWTSGVPLLVVGTARPELLARRADWGGGKSNSLTVSLSPLSDQETARLLQELLGGLLAAETQAELLVRAGGNPLYAEEFARMLRDRGGDGEIPETVQGLIAARIDLLEPDQKALLQNAAVIGKRFWTSALAALADSDPDALEQRLHSLERKEFVRRERSSSVVDESEYGFRHLLVRDVAYGQIPRAERAAKHLAAAGWFEQLGRREDYAEMLAHHYLQALELTAAAGGNVESFAADARRALADAGERAFALSAYDAAARFFRAALDLPSDEQLDRARLVLRLGRTLFLLGEVETQLLDQARVELLAAGDVEGAAEADATLGELHWMAGDRDPAFASLDRALELVDELPPSETKARVLALASRFNMLAGDYPETIRRGEAAIEMARRLGLREIEAGAMVNVGGARGFAGHTVTAFEEAIAVAREANAAFDICRATGNLASLHWVLGELERASALWEEAEAESERYGQKGFARWLRGLRPKIEYELGNWDAAYAEAQTFIAEVESGAPHYLAPQAYVIRAKIRIARGESEGGDIERGVELARRAKDPQILYEVVGMGSHGLDVIGESERALALAGEVVAAFAANEEMGFSVVIAPQLAWTMTRAGRGEEVVRALAGARDVPWTQAAVAFAGGDARGAAEILAGMGAATPEAYCRLEAARAGDLSQLEPALAFYRSVGAARFVREGEALIATSRSA